MPSSCVTSRLKVFPNRAGIHWLTRARLGMLLPKIACFKQLYANYKATSI